jgi:hypothetical protein
MGDVDRDVVLGHSLDAEPVRSLHLKPVAADILDVVVRPVVGVAAYDAGLVDEEGPVAPVEAEERQDLEQVDVLVDDDLLERRRLYPLDVARIFLVALDEGEELIAGRRILGQAERQCVVRPGAVRIHDDALIGEAGDVLELDRGTCLAELGQRACRRREVGLEPDLIRDTQQLSFLF